MDSQSFEELALDGKMLAGKEDMVDEGMEVTLVNFKGDAIEVLLPTAAVYTVTETGPNMGKDKKATLSSGAIITVPGYVDNGETIKVDTEKREFLSRDK